MSHETRDPEMDRMLEALRRDRPTDAQLGRWQDSVARAHRFQLIEN